MEASGRYLLDHASQHFRIGEFALITPSVSRHWSGYASVEEQQVLSFSIVAPMMSSSTTRSVAVSSSPLSDSTFALLREDDITVFVTANPILGQKCGPASVAAAGKTLLVQLVGYSKRKGLLYCTILP